MAHRDRYDWVVLGDHPGALLSACLVARAGLSVLIAPFHPARTLAVSSRTGALLDAESALLLGYRGLLGQCLRRIGLLASEEKAFVDHDDGTLQLLTPEVRAHLDPIARYSALESAFEQQLGGLPGGLKPWLAHWKKADPQSQGDKTWVEEYWEAFPASLTLGEPSASAHGSDAEPKPSKGSQTRSSQNSPSRNLWRKSSWQAAPPVNGLSPSTADLLKGLGLALGSESPQALSLVPLLSGSARFVGGLTAYRALLIRAARRLGADYSEGASCKRIFLKDGKLSGIQLEKKGDMISATGGVLGCSLDSVAESIDSDSQRDWERKAVAAPAPSGWAFTLAVFVKSEGREAVKSALPPGHSPVMVWSEAGAPAVQIEIAQYADYVKLLKHPPHPLDEASETVIFLRTLLPFNQESLDPHYQRLVAARLYRLLTKILPFIELHVTRIYPDFRKDSETALAAFSDIYEFAVPRLVPENLRFYTGNGAGFRSGVEGLFLATQEAYPQLGSLGPTRAALEAAAWICHRAGLAGPL